MPIRVLISTACAALLCSCGSLPKSDPAEPQTKAELKPIIDESARFPKTDLESTKVVSVNLIGKTFMPGGTLAHYRKGKREYDVFIAKLPSPLDAAILLTDWRKALKDPVLIPSFGGYFGDDNGQPLFVFSKGAWIAGIRGLPQKEADLQARILAAQLP
ncbi:MAG: hypothetical protein H7Y20_00565 [Bryobacteraceae bacterium]|nr:hypothetical protein [Bryobacteraceae bacterium]